MSVWTLITNTPAARFSFGCWHFTEKLISAVISGTAWNHSISQQIPSISRVDVHLDCIQVHAVSFASTARTCNGEAMLGCNSEQQKQITKTTYRTLICWLREDETRWIRMHWCLLALRSNRAAFTFVNWSQDLNLTVKINNLTTRTGCLIWISNTI